MLPGQVSIRTPGSKTKRGQRQLYAQMEAAAERMMEAETAPPQP